MYQPCQRTKASPFLFLTYMPEIPNSLRKIRVLGGCDGEFLKRAFAVRALVNSSVNPRCSECKQFYVLAEAISTFAFILEALHC